MMLRRSISNLPIRPNCKFEGLVDYACSDEDVGIRELHFGR